MREIILSNYGKFYARGMRGEKSQDRVFGTPNLNELNPF